VSDGCREQSHGRPAVMRSSRRGTTRSGRDARVGPATSFHTAPATTALRSPSHGRPVAHAADPDPQCRSLANRPATFETGST
jgi:hypothetical protein